MPEKKPLQPKTKEEMEKELMKCEVCGKPFIPVKDEISGKVTGHIFKGNCEHYPKGARFSVG